MSGNTHLAVGVIGGTVIAHQAKISITVITIAFLIIGSLIPDIDTFRNRKSLFFNPIYLTITIGSLLFIIYITNNINSIALFVGIGAFCMFTPHRTLSHSLIAIIAYSIALYSAMPITVIPFIIGYGLHLLCDSITHRGIKLFYPFSRH